MSEDNQQEKNQECRCARIDAFCKKHGIKNVVEEGGQEFSPYQGSHHFTKKPKQSSKD